MDLLKLDTVFKGEVIFPNDSNYDQARQLFYGGLDKRPAVIICVSDAEDIKNAILLAKKQKLELAIRSGGHSVSGYSSSDGGVVVDLRNMKKIVVDEKSKTVWAETGVLAAELTNELDKHNLALGFGDTGSVGIGGITLGGGVGFLVRKFGLAIDNLLAAEIVTATGEILRVDDKNHPDLFWALRGGGGNFGIVTKFRYKLHDLGDCYGGLLMLPASAEIIAKLMNLTAKAPNELSMIANVMPAFPLPFIPKKYHGKMSIMVLAVYAGDPKDGEKILAPIKALATPYADMLKPMRYKDIFMPEDPNYHPTAVSKNLHLNKVDLEVSKTAIDWLGKIDAPMRALQLRVLGGAMAEISDDATAYAHRKQPIMVNIASFYETEEEKQARQKWVDDFALAVNQGDNSAYVGFVADSEPNRLLDVYPESTLKRLKEVKHKYDPDNFFKLNFNYC